MLKNGKKNIIKKSALLKVKLWDRNSMGINLSSSISTLKLKCDKKGTKQGSENTRSFHYWMVDVTCFHIASRRWIKSLGQPQPSWVLTNLIHLTQALDISRWMLDKKSKNLTILKNDKHCQLTKIIKAMLAQNRRISWYSMRKMEKCFSTHRRNCLKTGISNSTKMNVSSVGLTKDLEQTKSLKVTEVPPHLINLRHVQQFGIYQIKIIQLWGGLKVWNSNISIVIVDQPYKFCHEIMIYHCKSTKSGWKYMFA